MIPADRKLSTLKTLKNFLFSRQGSAVPRHAHEADHRDRRFHCAGWRRAGSSLGCLPFASKSQSEPYLCDRPSTTVLRTCAQDDEVFTSMTPSWVRMIEPSG